MKRFSFTVILLLLFTNVIGMIGTGKVAAEEPPVFDAEEIQINQLKDPVAKADLIALGTITDKKYEVVSVGLNTDNVPGKFAYTIFTLSVEKVIKGNPDTKEVLIKVKGGPIGQVYQVPTGAYFSISDRMLALLHLEEDNVYTLPYWGMPLNHKAMTF